MKSGFGMRKLPCGEFLANATYFQFAMMAATVFCAWKHVTLPVECKSLTVQTLRFRMIHLAGIVQKPARSLILKIPTHYPLRSMFEKARWGVIGVAAQAGSRAHYFGCWALKSEPGTENKYIAHNIFLNTSYTAP